MSVSVRVDLNGALRKLDRTKEELKSQIPRALNKTADYGRLYVSRRISENYGARVGALKKALAVSRASSSNLRAWVKANGKKLNWIYFDAREVTDGVSVKDRHGRKLIKHAFIAVLRGGNKFVVRRVDGSKHKSRKVRKGGPELGIKLMSGPSVPNMFRTVIREDHLQQLLADRFYLDLTEVVRSMKFRRKR